MVGVKVVIAMVPLLSGPLSSKSCPFVLPILCRSCLHSVYSGTRLLRLLEPTLTLSSEAVRGLVRSIHQLLIVVVVVIVRAVLLPYTSTNGRSPGSGRSLEMSSVRYHENGMMESFSHLPT